MPNVKISAATDAGTLLSSDMLPVARSGDTNAYHATMAEIATYASISVSSGAYGNVGRNLLHNAQLVIWQRGFGAFTTNNAYTADRWLLLTIGDTNSVTAQTLADADRAAIGDEAAQTALQDVLAGSAGAGSYSVLAQRLENIQRLGNKTVTVSFWAKATAGTPKVGVGFQQCFGTGGSPSANVVVNATAVTLSTTWARYSVTQTLPSTSGKTLGTSGGDYLELDLWLSSGATDNTAAGGIGVQSGTFSFWGMQAEIGSVSTPLEKLSNAVQSLQCQRFYQTGVVSFASYGGAGTQNGAQVPFEVTMRGVPAIALSGQSYINASGAAASIISTAGAFFAATVTALGGVEWSANYTASADL